MKRAIVSSLVAFLMLALIVPTGLAAAKKINFTIWTKESEAEGVLQDIVKLTEDFAKSRPGLSFEIVNYGVEDLRQNFQSAAFAGAGPDLLWTVSDHAGPFVAMKIIRPADEAFGEAFLAGFAKQDLGCADQCGQPPDAALQQEAHCRSAEEH
mgnify:CR=1 FL=1